MDKQYSQLMHTSFSKLVSTAKLRALAQHPVDLTEKNLLTPDRMDQYKAEGASWKLFYGAQRINKQVMEALFELAQECRVFQQYEQMRRGEVINSSEKRPVLHTAVRDFFENPVPETKEQRARAYQECEKLKLFLDSIEGKYTDLVVIGIGGSNLGPEALYQSLSNHYLPNRRVHFISNIDPDEFTVFSRLDLAQTLVVVISKSGSTLETQTNEAFARDKFKKAGLNPISHFIGITTEGSVMDKPEIYLEMFYVWEYIGGRFCGTAMPGGIIVGFACGYAVYWEILRGAHAMDGVAALQDSAQNLPLLLALLGIWNRNFLKLPCYAVISYAHALRRFAAHVQQLDMESNGKHVDKNGKFIDFDSSPIVFGEPGTNAQHSFFQMLHQGTTIVPIEFIGCKNSQFGQDYTFQGSSSQQKLLSSLLGQVMALARGKTDENPNKQFRGNRPSSMLLTEQLTPFSAGALYALYEHKMAFQGFIWQINSFDQEGVSLGKKLANEVLVGFNHPDEQSMAGWFLKQ